MWEQQSTNRVQSGAPKAMSAPTKRNRTVAKRISLLHEATKIPARAERLVTRWRGNADWCDKQLGCIIDQVTRKGMMQSARILRRCASELERLLK